MGILRRLGLIRDRRARGDRIPVFVGARLEIGDLAIDGTARDLGAGGIFFETPVSLAPGLRGTLRRADGADPLVVRVSWHRREHRDAPAGLGLSFDPGYILMPRA